MKRSLFVNSIVTSVIAMSAMSAFAISAEDRQLVNGTCAKLAEKNPDVNTERYSATNIRLSQKYGLSCFDIAQEKHNRDQAKYDDLFGAKKDETGLNKATLLRQQKQCEVELKKQSCPPMYPAEDSGCVVGKEKIEKGPLAGQSQTNYVAYFNQRLSVMTVVDITKSCDVRQIYAAGKLKKFEIFDNKLFSLINGKPMLLDDRATLQELLSKQSNSYNDGNASISGMSVGTSNKTGEVVLKLERDLSKNTDTVQLIDVRAADIDKSRMKEVHASEWVRAYVKELNAIADVIR